MSLAFHMKNVHCMSVFLHMHSSSFSSCHAIDVTAGGAAADDADDDEGVSTTDSDSSGDSDAEVGQ